MISNVLADVAEQYFGRLRSNTDIICVDDLVVPLESKNSTASVYVKVDNVSL